MKANDGSGNIIERDDWETPRDLFKLLDNQYWIGFDCCATEKNRRCVVFSNDFLKQNDMGSLVCWMNPPFSKAKEMFEHFFKVINKGDAIYRCDNMETKIWQEVILKNADWIFIPKGRISYEGKEGTGSRFPSALIGTGVEPPIELKGVTLRINLHKSSS